MADDNLPPLPKNFVPDNSNTALPPLPKNFVPDGTTDIQKKNNVSNDSNVPASQPTTPSATSGTNPEPPKEPVALPTGYDRLNPNSYKSLTPGQDYIMDYKRGGNNVVKTWDGTNFVSKRDEIKPIIQAATSDTIPVGEQGTVQGAIAKATIDLKDSQDEAADRGIEMKMLANYRPVVEMHQLQELLKSTPDETAQKEIQAKIDDLKAKPIKDSDFLGVSSTPATITDTKQNPVAPSLDVTKSNAPLLQTDNQPAPYKLPDDIKTVGDAYTRIQQNQDFVNDVADQTKQVDQIRKVEQMKQLSDTQKQELSKVEPDKFDEALDAASQDARTVKGFWASVSNGLQTKIDNHHDFGKWQNMKPEDVEKEMMQDYVKQQFFGTHPEGMKAMVGEGLGGMIPPMAAAASTPLTGPAGVMSSTAIMAADTYISSKNEAMKQYYFDKFSKGEKPDYNEAQTYSTTQAGINATMMGAMGGLSAFGKGAELLHASWQDAAMNFIKSGVKASGRDALVFGVGSKALADIVNDHYNIDHDEAYGTAGAAMALNSAMLHLLTHAPATLRQQLPVRATAKAESVLGVMPVDEVDTKIQDGVTKGFITPQYGNHLMEQRNLIASVMAAIPHPISVETANRIVPLFKRKAALVERMKEATPEVKAQIAHAIAEIDQDMYLEAGTPLTADEKGELNKLKTAGDENKGTDNARIRYLEKRMKAAKDAADELKAEKQEAKKEKEETKVEVEKKVVDSSSSQVVSEEKPLKLGGATVYEHTEDTNTAQNLENGVKPTDLTPEGRAEAERLGKQIAKDHPDATDLHYSTVKRGKDTAQIVADTFEKETGRKLNMHPMDELQTADVGKADGKPEGTFDEHDWANNPDKSINDSETYNQFFDQVKKLREDGQKFTDKDIVLSHSKVMRMLKVMDESSDPATIRARYLQLGDEEKANVPRGTNAEAPKAEPVTDNATTEKAEPLPESNLNGIKNEATDALREKLGLPPRMKEARQSLKSIWDNAMKRLDSNPYATQELIEKIKTTDHVPTAEDGALLLHRTVELQTERAQVEQNIVDAAKDGDTGTVLENKVRLARIQDEQQELIKVDEKGGRSWGQAGVMRQQMLRDDFSIAQMERAKSVAANDGEPLTDKQTQEVADLHEKIKQTQAAYDDLQEKQRQQEAQHQAGRIKADIEHQAKVAELEKKLKANDKKFTTRAKAIGDKIRTLKTKPITFKDAAGNDIEYQKNALLDWNDLVEIAAKAAEKTGEFIDGVRAAVESLKDHDWYAKLPDIDKEAVNKQVEDHINSLNEKAKKTTSTKTESDDTINHEMLRGIVESGITDINDIVKAVKEKIGKPEASDREIRDAITKYGQTLELSKEDVEVALRKAKRMGRLYSQLEDIREQKRPLRSGLQRDKLDAEERALQKQIAAEEKGLPQTTEEHEKQLKSSLDAVKTRLRNHIEDLNREIETGEKTAKAKGVPYDEEATQLKVERDEVKKLHEEIFGKSELTDQQKIDMATKAVERAIQKTNEKIAENDLETKKSKTPNARGLKVARDILAGRKAELEKLREDAGIPEQKRLEQKKAFYEKQTADLQERLKNEDFAPKPKKPPVELDKEGEKLRAANERAKNDFKLGLEKDRLAKRPTYQKWLDTIAKVERFSKLTYASTLGKLTGAAATTLTTSPLEEAVGAGFSKILPSAMVDKAYKEVGINIKAEAKAITGAFTKGMDDAYKTMMIKGNSKGLSDLEAAYGKKGLPPEWLDLMAHIHGALKAPAKRAEFERSFEKRSAILASRGVDVTDPEQQLKIAMDAYKDGQRAIFMGDNILADKFANALNELDKKGGWKSVEAAIGRILVPFARVPLNVAGQTFGYSGGYAAEALGRVGAAIIKGTKNMTGEEQDMMLRAMKKGSVGLLFAAYGFARPQQFGGWYQRGGQLNKDVAPDKMKIEGVTIPSMFLHHPLLQSMQVGATLRMLLDHTIKKRSTETHGLIYALGKSYLGIVENTPLVGGLTSGIEKALESDKKVDQFIGNFAKNNLDPGIAQNIANAQDKKVDKISDYLTKDAIKRYPQNTWQYIETGLPYLRENVPASPKDPEEFKQKIKELMKAGKEDEAEKMRESFIKMQSDSTNSTPR